ncbi:MAG: ankyrin repeat domain-containing protein [Parashewanella sp.]
MAAVSASTATNGILYPQCLGDLNTLLFRIKVRCDEEIIFVVNQNDENSQSSEICRFFVTAKSAIGFDIELTPVKQNSKKSINDKERSTKKATELSSAVAVQTTVNHILMNTQKLCDITLQLVELANKAKDGEQEMQSSQLSSIISQLNAVLEHNVDINAKIGNEQFTILHAATKSGSMEIVKLIIKQHNIDLNTVSITGHTPLIFACQHSIKMVQLLIDAGATLDTSKNSDSLAPFLYIAAKLNQPEFIVDQISKQPELIHLKSIQATKLSVGALNITLAAGSNLLHFACVNPSADVLKQVLEHASFLPKLLEQANAFGKTPLTVALEMSRSTAAEYLLKAGAKVKTPFNSPSLLITAIHSQITCECLATLLKAGADANEQDITRDGQTPLLAAILQQNADACRLLIQHKADLSIRDLSASHQLPMTKALKQENAAVVKLFVEHTFITYVDMSANSNSYWPEQPDNSPLNWAIINNKEGLFTLMYERLLQGDFQSSRGYPLLKAIEYQRNKMITKLIKIPGILEHCPPHDKTPLQLVTSKKQSVLVGQLLEAGALTEHVNAPHYETPLIIAIENDDDDSVKALIKFNANLNAKKSRQTFHPLHLAVKKGNLPIVKLLLADPSVNVNSTSCELYSQNEEDLFHPIQVAVIHSQWEVTEYLLTHEQLDLSTCFGNNNIIQLAAKSDISETLLTSMLTHIQQAQFLSTEQFNNEVKALCYFALRSGNLAHVRACLTHGLDPTQPLIKFYWQKRAVIEFTDNAFDYANQLTNTSKKEQVLDLLQKASSKIIQQTHTAEVNDDFLVISTQETPQNA